MKSWPLQGHIGKPPVDVLRFTRIDMLCPNNGQKLGKPCHNTSSPLLDLYHLLSSSVCHRHIKQYMWFQLSFPHEYHPLATPIVSPAHEIIFSQPLMPTGSPQQTSWSLRSFYKWPWAIKPCWRGFRKDFLRMVQCWKVCIVQHTPPPGLPNTTVCFKTSPCIPLSAFS